MAKHRFILGTAGHVDHGKTQLVSRLTGWDTDRLKEEKERGISIELGFAPLKLDDDTTVGIVDVPGHERFVKHMVAGAGGIDMAILVVAADEGVMPQTREHLEVLRSLSVTYGAVVVTKIDLSSRETRAILDEDIAELVKDTFLQGAPVLDTSAVSGAGIDDLKQTLRELTREIPARDIGGPFRLAIDRVFHKRGIGVVVTGSCYSGTVSIGDALQLLPSEKSIRVREIQSFGEKRQDGYAGERLAIALQGAKPDGVSRGDMLVSPSHFTVGYMVDARIHVARYAKFEIKQRERVRLHHGAREVFGRVTLLAGDKVRSAEQCLAQLRLETPIVAGAGDYFVLRKYSPSRVIGGGRIIDPHAKKHRTNDPAVVETLRVLEQGDPADRVAKQVQSAGLEGVRTDTIDPVLVKKLVDEARVTPVAKILFHPDTLKALRERIENLATEYCEGHPLRYGIDKEELRQRVHFTHSAAVFNRVLERLAESARLFIKDNSVRAGTETIQLPAHVLAELDALEGIIKRAGFQFQREADISGNWRGQGKLSECLQFLRDTGRAFKVGEDAYIHTDVFESCLARLREWFDENRNMSVPDFKNLLNITRKQAIPLLEYLDANRYTMRRQDVRVPGARLNET
jgi:selenocysteine-specific elongation factor